MVMVPCLLSHHHHPHIFNYFLDMIGFSCMPNAKASVTISMHRSTSGKAKLLCSCLPLFFLVLILSQGRALLKTFMSAGLFVVSFLSVWCKVRVWNTILNGHVFPRPMRWLLQKTRALLLLSAIIPVSPFWVEALVLGEYFVIVSVWLFDSSFIFGWQIVVATVIKKQQLGWNKTGIWRIRWAR